MSDLERALAFAREEQPVLLDRLRELVSIRTISTQPECGLEIERAARWLAARLTAIGMNRVELLATGGQPTVYAEWLGAPGKPTLLVYGHYDVQPPDPIEEWESPPFEATIRGENLYARGASDMKGSLLAFLQAVEALGHCGPLPVNLRFLLDGEEEIGSPNLETFVDRYRDRVAADAILNCDGETHAPGQPSISYGVRGLAYFEVEVRGPAHDLHSGVFGGSLHNPAQVLCELIAGMHDADGRVTLPGFYDAVRPLDEEERRALARIPLTDMEWQAMTGAPGLWGETGFTVLERVGARPTIEVNGIWAGFTGEGSKTVLPAKATAKISTRLVPDQDPGAIQEQLTEYLRRHAPATVTWEVREYAHAAPAVMDRNSVVMRAAVAALRDTFGTEPVFKREGGTIPFVAMMQEKLGIDTVMLGFRLPDDNMHAPNEKQHLPTLYRGVEAFIRLMIGLG